jgi:ABC-2 type transport system ATP-binding protein
MRYDVETFSLTKIFSDWWGRQKVCAVDNLDLKIQHNEVFGFLGPNGSGKTTTLKMLLGLLYPTKGRAVVLGGDSTDPKISSRIGFMPEESYLYRYLTARETLDFYGSLFGLPSKVRKMRIEALLDMVGLKAVANRHVGTYSKGMARRIGLAQALINDPDLLILDEPTTGLDPIGTRQIKDLILELAKRGKTILLSSHLLADVEDVCDRIAILYGGRIQAQGQVKELLQRSDKRQITTGNISSVTLEKIKQLVSSEHVDFDISSPMEKLETFFIRTVAEAREQAQPTSGAVSTTQIGDFLAAKPSQQENILDKLVSTPVVPTNEETPIETVRVTPVEPTHDVKPDKELLAKLTEQSAPVETTPISERDLTPTVPVTPEMPQQIREDILDELTGRSQSKPQDVEEQLPDKGDQTSDA